MRVLKKRIAAVICLIFIVCPMLCGCARIRELRRPLADHLENFETDFTMFGDVEKQLSKLYETSPQWQVFLDKITYENEFVFGSRVEIKYVDTDIAYNDVEIAAKDEEILPCLSRQMRKCLKSGAIVVTDSRNSEPDISGICDKLQQDEYLTMMGFYSMECSFHSNSVTEDLIIKYRCEYSQPTEQLLQYRREIGDAVTELSGSLWTKEDSDYDRVKAIHDHIIDHTQYNTGKADDMGDHTPYGVFVLGRSVCEGYTLAAKLLLDEAGIENLLVEGSGRGENHIWNMVKLDDKYYHLDVTWDDPVDERGGKEYKEYDYFLVSDEVMKKDHQWDGDDVPAAPENYE